MNDFSNSFESLIESILELDDTDYIEDLISLFCYNNKLMPGSENFNILMNEIGAAMCNKTTSRVITKFREHIDEYE